MSLRARLLAAFAYVLTLVLLALVVPLALNLSERTDAEIEAKAAGEAQLIAASAAGRLDREDELARLARSASRDLGGRVIVVDERGRLLVDSEGGGLRAVSYATRPEIRAALQGRSSQGERHSESLDEDLLFTTAPVLERGRTTGAVRVTQSVEAVDEEVRDDVLALVAIGLLALALGLVVAWVIAGSTARPLRALAATARRIAGGDLSARASVEGAREQREVAEAFNQMTERLERSLAAQREFTGNASHQLRTPLTGLRLRLEAAALKTSEPDVRRDLEAGEREVERLADLVTGLLALAREGERPAADASASLEQAADAAIARWADVASRDGRTLVRRGAAPTSAHAAPEDVSIVLDNLIENALDHSPPGGAVTVELGSGDGEVFLAVLDEGPGIEPGEAERLFERFYRGGAQTGGGSGLGLAVVRALAERWGGRARAENRPEGGARVEVRFPAESAALDGSLDAQPEVTA